MLSASASPDASYWFTADAPDPRPRMPGQPQDSLWTEPFAAHRPVPVFQALARQRLPNAANGGWHLQLGPRLG